MYAVQPFGFFFLFLFRKGILREKKIRTHMRRKNANALFKPFRGELFYVIHIYIYRYLSKRQMRIFRVVFRAAPNE